MTRTRRILEEKLAANGHPPLDHLVPQWRLDGRSWRECAGLVSTLSGEPCVDVTLQRWFTPSGVT